MIGKTKIQLSHASVGKALEAYLNDHFDQLHQVRVEKWQPATGGAYGGETTDVQVEVFQNPEEPADLDLRTTKFTRAEPAEAPRWGCGGSGGSDGNASSTIVSDGGNR